MNSLSSYLIIMFTGMFWVFRIVVALTNSIGMEIGFAPMNITYEIVLLFVTLISMVLLIKRNLLGGIIYFASYFWYFGTDAYNNVIKLTEETAGTNEYLAILVAGVALILALANLLDIIITKSKNGNNNNKKSDWFYKNKQFDRKIDERADKNNYRI